MLGDIFELSDFMSFKIFFPTNIVLNDFYYAVVQFY